MHTLLGAQQVPTREHRQPALCPLLARQQPKLLEPLERQSVAITRRRADVEAQELEPIAEPALADHPLAARGEASRRQKVAQAPEARRREAQHYQVTVGPQDSVYL